MAVSITLQNITDVNNMYVALFGRAPDGVGLGYWARELAGTETVAPRSLVSVANSMFAVDAARPYYASSLTNKQIVESFYVKVLGRAADTEGSNYWTAELNKPGATPGSVIVDMVYATTNFVVSGLPANAAVDAAGTLSKTLFANKVEVSTYFGNTNGSIAAGEVALNGVDATPASVVAAKAVIDNVVVAGQPFTLTTGTDTGTAFTGGAGNDTFNASTGLSADGTTAIATTNALDSINGGAGNDTLIIENTGGKNTLTGTVTSVENLTFVGAGNVNDNADIASTNFSGAITFKQTTDTGVKVTALKAQTVALNTVADSTTATLVYDAAQTSASLSNAAAAGDATFSISGAGLTSVAVATDKTASTKTLTVTDTGNKIKTASIAASGAASVSVGSTALEAVTITGSAVVTLTAGTAPTKTLDSSASTGGVTYATDLVGQLFTGGAGKDTVQFGATTKAQTLGAGDDKATISADLATGGTIDAGIGTDTLSMSATLAASLDDTTAFNAKVSNFEKLHVTAATNQTLNLINLDGLNYVIESGTGNTLTIDNMLTGGTIEFTDTSTATAVLMKDAATGTADVLNVKLTAAATFAAGTLTAANIETVNIESDDTATTAAADGSVKHTLTLTADKATTIKVTGDASLNLTLTGSTKVTSIDASAATSGFTTDLSVASGITLTGTAKVDTITLGQLSIVTGGAGTDVYTVTTPTNGNTYATITDFTVGETIQFTEAAGGGTPTPATLGTKVALASTAAFADFLAAASAADGSANSAVKWFQYSGDTYVAFDNSVSTTFDNGVDQLVKLTGTVDLSKATVSAAGLLTFVAA